MTEAERLHYPADPKLREAYIGLLGMVCMHKKIKFTGPECISAICDRNGWIVETDHYGAVKTTGQGKKAKNYLQILAEGQKYVRRDGLCFEICAYDASTLERIVSFDELFATIGDDRYLAEYLEPVDELSYQPWEDVTELQLLSSPINSISEEVAMLCMATPITCEKEDVLEASFISLNKDVVLLNPEKSQIDEDSEISSEVGGRESRDGLI